MPVAHLGDSMMLHSIRWILASGFLLFALLLLGCSEGSAPDSGALVEPDFVELTKVTPVSVEGETDAWALFDRSTSRGWSPSPDSDTAVLVSLPHGAGGIYEIAALKVFGASPFQLKVEDSEGDAIVGLERLDLSELQDGWNVFGLRTAVSTSTLTLRFTPLGGATTGSVSELEIWGRGRIRTRDDQVVSSLHDVDAELPPHLDLMAAQPPSNALGDETRCVLFSVEVTREPATFRRAFVLFETEGAFRSFVLSRSINVDAPHGGLWLTGSDDVSRRFVDPIDPRLLRRGENTVRYCLPPDATNSVTLKNLHLVGETEHGSNLTRALRVGERDVSGEQTISLSAETPLVVEFERTVAPDALVLSGTTAHGWQVSCDNGAGSSKLASRSSQLDGDTLVVLEDPAQLACRSLTLTRPGSAELTGVAVIGSGAREPIDWPQLTVASAREHFGHLAWVAGWASAPSGVTGPVYTEIDGVEQPLLGSFGSTITRTSDLDSPWIVHLGARFPGGERVEQEVVLDENARQELQDALEASGFPTWDVERYGMVGQQVTETVTPEEGGSVRLGTVVGVDVPAGGVNEPTDISVRHLGEDSLPPLDPWLVNVTAPEGHGYEFMPHGQQFLVPVQVLLPYERELLPEGSTEDDVQAYYYDEVSKRWEPLERYSLDTAQSTTTSLTEHFTIMINAVLTVPDNPSPQAFNPQSLPSMAAAAPAANVVSMQPPSANQSGAASSALPLVVPPGRGATSPSLALTYSSERGNGWLGVGWDLTVSRIELDSRFGVPTYSPEIEPRYVLDGTPLVPTGESDGPGCRNGGQGTRYRPRVEGAFNHIIRCGDDAESTYWVVRDRAGTTYYYTERGYERRV